MTHWPPPYTIRKHRLTKRVKLVASQRQGLVVSVPLRFSVAKIPAILEEHKVWIMQQIAKLHVAAQHPLPTTVQFTALAQVWTITYLALRAKLQIIERPGCEIVVAGSLAQPNACLKLIANWIKSFAYPILQQELMNLSQELGLPYNKLVIRDQTSRWGSCNNDKNISLNYKLLFLPYPLMRHILIHELSHTKELNHSKRFWALVTKFDPDCHAHRKALRQANTYIPAWL